MKLLLFFISFNLFGAPLNWKMIQEKEGISVFKEDLKSSSLVSFKGVGVVDAPIKKVFNIIMDTARAPEWVSDMEKSEVLKWINSPHEYIEYNHIGMPLFLSDRDFISRVHIKKIDSNTLLVNYLPPPKIEMNTGNIRGRIDGSYFKLSALDKNKTKVEGVVVCDPKGLIPKWVVNLFQKNWPYETINGIRKQALKKDLKIDPKFNSYFN